MTTAIELDEEGEQEQKVTAVLKPDPGSSFLVAEIGRITTSATLIDEVDGVYRVIAEGGSLTTAGPPWYDARHGFREAINKITGTTGRLLLNEDGVPLRPRRSSGHGIDYFGLVTAVAEPMQTLLVGLLADVSLLSGRAALKTAYAREVDCFFLGDNRTRTRQIQTFLSTHFDLVFVVGGTDGGADRRLIHEVETVAIGLELLARDERPPVIYAGNMAIRSKIERSLGELTKVYYADNVRPTYERQDIDSAVSVLGEVYIHERVRMVPGMDEILSWCSFPAMPIAHSFAAVAEYMAEANQGRVLAIDGSSDSATFVEAQPGRINLRVSPDLASGREPFGILETGIGSQELGALSTPLSMTEMRNYLMNKAARPQMVPISKAAIEVDQLLTRQLISQLTQDGENSANAPYPETDSFLLCGPMLVRHSNPGQALLSALDGVLPTGIFNVFRDSLDVMSTLGLLAAHMPKLVVEVLEFGVLDRLACVVAPFGRVQLEEPVLRIRSTGGNEQDSEIQVRGGEVKVIPVPPGKTLSVLIEPQSQVDVGSGPGKRRRLSLSGYRIGLLIDARGRPLLVPDNVDKRRDLNRRWQLAVSH